MIAYAESPLQVICIMEYCKNVEIERFYIRKSLKNNDIQIVETLKLYEKINQAIFLEDYSKLKFLKSWISFILSNFRRKVLFGAANSKIKFLFPKRIEFDDGTHSISLLKKGKGKKLYTFFEISRPKNHSFEFLKAKFQVDKIKTKNNEVLIIGQPLIQLKILGIKEYISLIKTKIDDLELPKHSKIIYVAHRREAHNVIKELRYSLKCEIMNLSLPLELLPISNGYKPRAIIGFCSTALITVPLIFDVQKIIIYSDKLLLENKRSIHIQNTYSYLLK